MTTTKQALYQLARQRLLTFQPLGGAPPLGQRLGNPASPRLYTVQAPDEDVRPAYQNDAGWPYAVLDIQLLRSEDFKGLRLPGVLTLTMYDYPRTQQWRASGLADTAHEALLEWVAAASGLLFLRHLDRLDAPPAPVPMDRELVVIRLTASLVVWPRWLTQYANR